MPSIMKKKYLLSILVIVIASLLYVQLETEDKTAQLKKSHADFLRNHPYNKTKSLSKQERKLQGLPPNAFFEQEYLNEINPATGRTHISTSKRPRSFKAIRKNSW
jgi:hypothetical protein